MKNEEAYTVCINITISFLAHMGMNKLINFRDVLYRKEHIEYRNIFNNNQQYSIVSDKYIILLSRQNNSVLYLPSEAVKHEI